MFTKDLIERAVRTFIQAALAVVAANLAGVTSLDTAKGVGIAAASAGISAVMSLIAKNWGEPTDASFQADV